MQQTVDAPDRIFTVEEFIAAYTGREGKFELVDGKVDRVSPERLLHAIVKSTVAAALGRAVEEAGRPYFVAVDGVAVQVGERSARVPDLVVADWGAEDSGAMLVRRPLIVVEILSLATENVDKVRKLGEYRNLASLTDYLIVDPDAKIVTCHTRRDDGTFDTVSASQGALGLSVGLIVDVEAFWPRRP